MSYRYALLASLSMFVFGPPSLKIEAVSNPDKAAIKGAVFMITGHHHGQSVDGFGVTARAEGLVAGKRVTKTLSLKPTGKDGEFGVLRQWDAGSPWVLIFTVTEDGHDSMGVAEGAVRIAANGKVMGIDFPMQKTKEGYPWPRKVAKQEIESALTSMSKP